MKNGLIVAEQWHEEFSLPLWWRRKNPRNGFKEDKKSAGMHAETSGALCAWTQR